MKQTKVLRKKYLNGETVESVVVRCGRGTSLKRGVNEMEKHTELHFSTKGNEANEE